MLTIIVDEALYTSISVCALCGSKTPCHFLLCFDGPDVPFCMIDTEWYRFVFGKCLYKDRLSMFKKAIKIEPKGKILLEPGASPYKKSTSTAYGYVIKYSSAFSIG